jgi:hypothetical protein
VRAASETCACRRIPGYLRGDLTAFLGADGIEP